MCESTMSDKKHVIDFRVPLSGSQLFDIHSYTTAKKLCADFPELHFKASENEIHIYGELDSHSFQNWNRILFTIASPED